MKIKFPNFLRQNKLNNLDENLDKELEQFVAKRNPNQQQKERLKRNRIREYYPALRRSQMDTLLRHQSLI